MKEQVSVLVVDDNVDLLDTFSSILKRKGYQVETAADGVIAVDKIQARPFDIVLMDVIMPRMNGVEALRRVRELNPAVKIIMMTAYADEGQLQEALNRGAYCALHKPVNIAQLVELIGEATVSPLVLIVDDDSDFCRTLARALELQGYKVESAYNGEEAISISRKKKCQIALVDVKMPFMDGLETYLRLREINSSLAAIMMTGYGEEMNNTVEKAMLNSAVTCLYKPFDPSQALALVGKLSGHRVYGGKNGGQGKYTAG